MQRLLSLLPLAAALAAVGCSSTYYGAMEKLGFAKRDILVDRVDETRQAQAGAASVLPDSNEVRPAGQRPGFALSAATGFPVAPMELLVRHP